MITVGLNLRGVREFQFIFHNLYEISFIWYQKLLLPKKLPKVSVLKSVKLVKIL
jgi:hypothetical protein